MNNFATAQSCLRGHCFYAFGLFAAAASAALTVRMACIGKMDSEPVESHEDTRLFNHLSSRDRIKRGNKYDILKICERTLCRLSGRAPKLQMNSTPHIESCSSDQVEGHEYAAGFTRLSGICEITHRLKHRVGQSGFRSISMDKGRQRTGSLSPYCSSTGDKTSRAPVRSGWRDNTASQCECRLVMPCK